MTMSLTNDEVILNNESERWWVRQLWTFLWQ